MPRRSRSSRSSTLIFRYNPRLPCNKGNPKYRQALNIESNGLTATFSCDSYNSRGLHCIVMPDGKRCSVCVRNGTMLCLAVSGMFGLIIGVVYLVDFV